MHDPRQKHVRLLELLMDDQSLIVLRNTTEDMTLINSCLLDALDGPLIATQAHVRIECDHSCNVIDVGPSFLAFNVI